MIPVSSLAFVHLFDVILITGLIHYYRRLRYPFLKYGACAIGINVVYELASHMGLLGHGKTEGALVSGASELLYATLLLAAAADIAGRTLTKRILVLPGAIGFLIVLTIVLVRNESGWASYAILAAPAAIVLVSAAVMVTFSQATRSIGTLWFGVFLVLTAVISLIGHYPPNGLATIELLMFSVLTHLLTGVTLIMITSERTIIDLGARDQRIERFAEDRKRLEVQFSQAQKLESLGVMAGGIAHDFNNMLTSILGYASLAMKKLPTDSEIRKDLYMVMSGARQAVDLTSQMLIYAGKGALDFGSVDMTRVVENASSLINSIVPKRIQLVQRLGRDLPSLKGDQVQLGQVVMNLIANAVDAIEEGAGVIELSTGLSEVDDGLLRQSFFAEERAPGAYIHLRVKDTGIGMNKEQVERMFDPFYSEKRSNRGLGLSSLSGVVRQHNGFITVRSMPGEGTDFTIYFPVLSVDDSPRRAPANVVSSNSPKGRVLLADDDPRIRSLMASILEGEHYSLVVAEDGREALSLYREHRGQFDLLLLDCTMPKMSGTELYRQLRSDGVRTPIVLVSGYHQEQVVRNIENDPNGRFIKKPFNVDDFLQEVRESLATSRTLS